MAGGVRDIVKGAELAQEVVPIERAASRPIVDAVRRITGFKRVHELDAVAAKETAVGFADVGLSVGGSIHEVGRSFLDDKPWWYNAIKSIPFPGVGMAFAIGEELKTCLFP